MPKIEFDPTNPQDVAYVAMLIGIQPGATAHGAPAPAPAAPAPVHAPAPFHAPAAPTATQADMAAAIQRLAIAKKPAAAKALLASLGYASSTSVPPEAYATVIEAASAAAA